MNTAKKTTIIKEKDVFFDISEYDTVSKSISLSVFDSCEEDMVHNFKTNEKDPYTEEIGLKRSKDSIKSNRIALKSKIRKVESQEGTSKLITTSLLTKRDSIEDYTWTKFHLYPEPAEISRKFKRIKFFWRGLHNSYPFTFKNLSVIKEASQDRYLIVSEDFSKKPTGKSSKG